MKHGLNTVFYSVSKIYEIGRLIKRNLKGAYRAGHSSTFCHLSLKKRLFEKALFSEDERS